MQPISMGLYNTIFPLNYLTKNDKVKIKFKNQLRVEKRFRGKTIEFFVRHITTGLYFQSKEYQIIFQNVTDKEQEIIVMRTSRFEGLLVDLFPCNRIEFYQFRQKTIEIELLKPKTEFFNKEVVKLLNFFSDSLVYFQTSKKRQEKLINMLDETDKILLSRFNKGSASSAYYKTMANLLKKYSGY
jgi:hypothetical protein